MTIQRATVIVHHWVQNDNSTILIKRIPKYLEATQVTVLMVGLVLSK